MPNSQRLFISVFFLMFAGHLFAQAPAILPGGVLNGASFDKTGQPVAPGSLVSIFGNNLAFASQSASSVPLSTSLSSVTVTLNGSPIPLKDVVHLDAYDQINAQIPWGVLPVLPPGSSQVTNATVIITRSGVPSAPFLMQVGTTAPGIFTFPGGVGQAVAYGNVDGAIAAPSGAGLPFASHPAKVNDPATLVILATGLGDVDNRPADGGIPPPGVLVRTLTTPVVFVGGKQAQVVFSGLSAYVGVYQLNVILAADTTPGDAIPVQIGMNGFLSRNDVTIAVTQ
jgi:uncharacterized protein (TIGR03437 family)